MLSRRVLARLKQRTLRRLRKLLLNLQARLFGLLLFGLGFAIVWVMFAFWRSGFQTPVKAPLPAGMDPRMAFAFNPVVCAMPFLTVGGLALMAEGIRRAIDPGDTIA